MVSALGIIFSLLSTPTFASFSVDLAYAPSTNLNLTVDAIKSAQHSILLNIYELSSPEIADALLGQINAGIHVEILEEGQPYGGFSAASKGIESQLIQAMNGARGNDHFFVMSSNSGKRRFRFDHAKYAVIDGTQLLIGSENYSPTGNPAPGSLGNRGWEVFIHDAGISQNYQSVFTSDSSINFGDVQDLTNNHAMLELETKWIPQQLTNNSFGSNTVSADSVQRISAPDSSLSGILSLISHAKHTIDIELMTFDSVDWNGQPNPLIAALQTAAKRGVSIRVLLNNESAFGQDNGGGGNVQASRPKNQPTADLLSKIGNIKAMVLSMQALHAMGVDYIHNKGMIIDNSITLISSINWDENSFQNNREAAVAISGSSVASFYENLFQNDWRLSGGQ